MMKAITLAIAMSLACSAASAQQTWTEQRFAPDGALVTTRSDGSMTETTSRRGNDGATTYTTTHTPGPPSMSETAPPASPSVARRNGTWTGYEGSPRDRAWVEACNPQIVTDREGIDRYVYAKRGCEYGDAP